jgi:hypothetical protein
MQVGGASVKDVTRGEEPSSAGHGVGPVNDWPTGAGVGGTPVAGSGRVVEADGVEADVVVVADVPESEREPR